jgi:LuxR family maltose regulon positive regulatory protein
MDHLPTGSPRLLRPSAGAGVARPRLDDLLTRAVDTAAVTLVSAGAGSGKTTAVARWAETARPDGALSWVNLDRQDNDYATLRRDVLGALAGDAKTLAPARGSDSLAAAAQRILATRGPAVLVLDDLQEIADKRALEAVRDLIEHRPHGLRLVLISRSDPPLRLQRWRIDGRLAEIRAKDLAFERGEAAELFRQYHIELGADQLDVVMTRTQGWAAGLRLAAMSLHPEAVEAGIAGFAGDQHGVAEYLVGEVLDHLPARVQRLLLRMSVVDEITASLAEHLSGDGGVMTVLRRLADDNELLFSFGADRLRFRYHPLLRQLLVHQLMASDPEVARGQHRRAAQWFGANGEPVPAVRHALQARDPNLVRQVLANSAIPALYTHHAPALGAALRGEGAADGPPEAPGSLQAAVGHVLDGNEDSAADAIAQARKALPRLYGEAHAVEATALDALELAVAAARPDAETTLLAAEHALRGLQIVPAGLAPVIPAYRAIALGHLGAALLWSGRPAQAERYLFTAARQALGLHLPALRAECLGHVGLLRATKGEVHSARLHAGAALHVSENGRVASVAALTLAYAALQRGEVEAAARRLDELADAGDGLVGLAAAYLEADLQRTGGAHPKASALLDELAQEAKRKGANARLVDDWCAWLAMDLALQSGEYAVVLGRTAPGARTQIRYARAELGLNRLDAAEARLRPLLHEPEALTAIEAWLTYAAVRHRRGHGDAAVRAVGHALALAEPEGLRQPFLVFGAPCLSALLEYQEVAAGNSAFAAGVADALRLAQTPVPLQVPGRIAPELIEPLTDRELLVLRYLPTLRGNTEIGESLFVTVNTVKAHLKSVYRKLGVNSRRAAVERARELHLL